MSFTIKNILPPKTFTELYECMQEVLGPDKYFTIRIKAIHRKGGAVHRRIPQFEIDLYIEGHPYSRDCQNFTQAWYEFCKMVGHEVAENITMKEVDIVIDENEHDLTSYGNDPHEVRAALKLKVDRV